MNAGRRAGTEFGPYRIEELVGRGGMGEVYRAYDTVKNRYVALKLLDVAAATDPTFEQRFRRESQVVARLGEPHVVPIHDFGEIDGVLFIDMRLVAGRDLRAILGTEGAMPAERAVKVIEQVAAALDAAHADGLVHRDVKPENILLTDDDFAYLVDFGIAHGSQDTRLTQVGSAIGSVAYMAPELFDSTPITSAADVYALTSVLFECLTGAVPHPADSISAAVKATVLNAPPAVSSRNPSVSPAFDEVVRRGLARDPRSRFGSARELAQASRAALTAPVVARPESPAPTLVDTTPPDAHGSGAYAETGLAPARGGYAPPQVPTPYQTAGQGFTASPGSGYGAAPYPVGRQGTSSSGSSSRVMVPLIGAVVVILLGLLALGAYWLFSQRDDADGPAAQPTPTITETITPTVPAQTGPAAPPPGSTPCEAGVGVGSPVTTCQFARVVLDEYNRASGGARDARVINAYSPVTSRSYAMSCVPEGAIIVCRGGNDAVVHIY